MIALDSASTFLFVPGDRRDRFGKAAASGADVVVLDLEDAVAPGDKDAAREDARGWLAAGGRGVVRINAAGTKWFEADAELVRAAQAPVMLPKTEQPAVLAELTGLPVIALVETALGVENARAFAAAPGVARLAFGSVDLAAQLGVAHDDRAAMDPARSRLVLASAAAGLPAPIDGVTTRLDDLARAGEDARRARRLGFGGKLCVHPRQVEPVRTAFAPTTSELAWARRIVKTAGLSAAAIDGQLVDKPVVDRARRLLEAHARGEIR
ncbi:HpcH/HpaI aldolase/citrate lyase family protein [Amycolatopsis eburnea]|uniref:HpcH/HpaI aldolase/citrate lyase family protein n=1 Tax=Amycolatopsis eburnea TaxID=2267691 RepID=UPI0026D3FABE